MRGDWMDCPYAAQLRAAKAEGELARIRDALRDFAEENGLNPEMEPRDLLAKAAGALRSCAAMSDARYTEIQELRAEMEAMRPRLMPEGMEWPAVDGEPVDFVTGYEPSLGVLEAVSIYSNGACEVMGHDGIIKDVKEIHVATPKVLDADGVEIREKRDAWWICEGDERGVHAERLRVETIGLNGLVECSPYNGGTWVYLEPSELYVNKPVLDADGRPLREGETVWSVDSGTRYTVEIITDELIPVKCRSEMGSTVSLHPSQLTHERPDSWERIEADCMQDAKDYCEEHGIEPEHPKHIGKAKCEDLVRRSKKLAGVEP